MAEYRKPTGGLISPNIQKPSVTDVETIAGEVAAEGDSLVKISGSDTSAGTLTEKLLDSDDIQRIIGLDGITGEQTMHFDLINPLLKNNFTAITIPTPNDDSGDGYAIGSVWFDTTNNTRYWVCVDATSGVALWRPQYFNASVRVTNGDTTPAELRNKIADGTNIAFVIGSPGGNENLTADLTNTTVSAGSYTNADITVDEKGRITAATSGITGAEARTNHVLVKEKADLPAPSGGIITLADNTSYELNGQIVLGTDYIQCGISNLIYGIDKSDDGIVYTGTGGAIRSTDDDLSLRSFYISTPTVGGKAFDLVGGVGMDKRVEIAELIFTGCDALGDISGGWETVTVRNNLATGCSGGLTFSDDTNDLFITDNPLENFSGTPTFIDIISGTYHTIIISRNMFESVASQTILNIDPSVVVTDGGIIAENAFEGLGTYLTGIDASNEAWKIAVDSNVGVAGLRRLDPREWIDSTYATTSDDFVITPTSASFTPLDYELYQENSNITDSGTFEVAVNHDQSGQTLAICITTDGFTIRGFGMDDKFTILDITPQGGDVVRYSFDGTEGITGFEPFDLARVDVGDTATFDSCTNAANNGTFEIVAINDVGTKYVDVINPTGVSELASPGLGYGGSVVYHTLTTGGVYENIFIPSVALTPNTEYRVGLRRYTTSGGNPNVRVSNTGNVGFHAPINY